MELYFHYNFGGKNYLSPISFGRPDPIVEFAEQLKSTGNSDDWKLGKSLEPKMRTYAPVVVRGKESEGVKFWGFGKTVYQELLGFISDPDYGDITDPSQGRDITVEFTPVEGGYPKTAIRIKPNQTPITEDQNVISKLTNQQDITEIFKEPTYDELQEALDKYMEPGTEGDESSSDGGQSSQSDQTSNETSAPKVEDVGSAFKELFNQ